MTEATVDHLTVPSEDTGLTWNRATFDGLRAVLGDEKAEGILSRFWLDLCRRFEDIDDGELLRKDAHVVKSTAGLLGFESLEEAAQSLEAACLRRQPFKDLAKALDVRRRQVGEALLLRSHISGI